MAKQGKGRTRHTILNMYVYLIPVAIPKKNYVVWVAYVILISPTAVAG
jgi:hypothetical protein